MEVSFIAEKRKALFPFQETSYSVLKYFSLLRSILKTCQRQAESSFFAGSLNGYTRRPLSSFSQHVGPRLTLPWANEKLDKSASRNAGGRDDYCTT